MKYSKKNSPKDWRAPIREALLKEEDVGKLMKGKLYHRML